MVKEKVLCIVVSYNGMRWIKRCLDNLQSSSCQSQIIVIDNNSKDETVNFIRKNYPTIQLLETGKNLGFGQGNNLGLAIAIKDQADYVFLINQDAYVETNTLEKLIEAHKKNPEFGILSPIHLNGSGSDFDEHFYKFLIESDVKEIISSQVLIEKKTANIVNTSFVNAAVWLISRECLIKTGGFDPIFFHYGEDDNYAQRVLFKGFKIGILTTTKIYHDKLRALSTNATADPNLTQDKIIFLNQACDLHQKAYKKLMVKRFLRYAFLTVQSIVTLDKKSVYYNSGMAKYIAFSFGKVKNSRNDSQNKNIPYLKDHEIQN